MDGQDGIVKLTMGTAGFKVMPMKDLAKIADSNISTMSRQLIDLGSRNRRMEPGYMLIEQRQNPMNLRENQYSVTLKGNPLLKGILKHLKRTKASA